MQERVSKSSALELPVSMSVQRRKTWSKALRRSLFNYKVGLAAYDVLMVTAGFAVSAAYFRADYLSLDSIQIAFAYGAALIAVAFYQTFRLYDYHLIFSFRHHFKNLWKAFALSAGSYALTVVALFGAPFLSSWYAIPVVFMMAAGIMLASRFYSDQLVNILKLLGLAFVTIGVLGMVSREDTIPLQSYGRIVLTAFFIAAALTLLTRTFLVSMVFSRWLRRRFRRQVLIAGSDLEAEKIASHIIKLNAPFWIAGTIGAEKKHGLRLPVEKSFLGDLKTLPALVEKLDVREIIVTDEGMDKRTLISILDFCTSAGLNVWFHPHMLPIIDMKLYIDSFCGIPLIRLCSQKNQWLFNKVKHGLDALITLPAMILLLPFFALIGAAIKLNSKGPVFYRAEAIGKNGEPFAMLKFRSMSVNSDPRIHKQYVSRLIKGEIGKDGNPGEPLKITNDPRVTAVGGLLRKTSLDELPQLINVIKGEMSLVGPRPCLPYEWEIYEDWYKKRAVVRPGITGLWQIAGRSEVAFEDMILLDLYYIYNRNLMMDFQIIYETIFTVLMKKGAY